MSRSSSDRPRATDRSSSSDVGAGDAGSPHETEAGKLYSRLDLAEALVEQTNAAVSLRADLEAATRRVQALEALAYLDPQKRGRTWKDACVVAQHDADAELAAADTYREKLHAAEAQVAALMAERDNFHLAYRTDCDRISKAALQRAEAAEAKVATLEREVAELKKPVHPMVDGGPLDPRNNEPVEHSVLAHKYNDLAECPACRRST